MTTQVALELPKELYDRVQKLASYRQQPVSELLINKVEKPFLGAMDYINSSSR